MRIWDLPPTELCRAHLLGEHRELHGLWNVLTQGKRGYAAHPETHRLRGKLRYVASLGAGQRAALRERLQAMLPISGDGSISVQGHLWAVRGTKPSK